MSTTKEQLIETTTMVQTMRYWTALFCIGLGLAGFAAAASAETVDDPTFSSVAVELSSTTPGDTGVTADFTFTTVAEIPVGYSIIIDFIQVDCAEYSWDNCQWDVGELSASDVSGMSGLTINEELSYGNYLVLDNAEDIPAGSYVLSVHNLSLPNYNGAYRAYMSTWASDNTGLEEYFVATKSDPFMLGEILVTGTIADADGNPVNTYGQVRDESWSVYRGFDSDQWGFYAVGAEAFAGITGTLYATVYPDTVVTGLATTTETFDYSGSTVALDIEPNAASKTITGTIVYEETGEGVSTAAVYASSATGDGSSTDADVNGEFTMTLGGGSYTICLSDQYDDETGESVQKDWYVNWEDNCQDVEFADDNSVETEALEFVVHLADARIEGVFVNPDGSFPVDGGWVSFWTDGLWFGGNVDSSDGSFSVAVVGGDSSISATTLRARAIGSTVYQAQYTPSSHEEHTYWDEVEVEVNADETLDLGTIVLAERDVVYTATVVDQDGNPVQGIQVSAWQDVGGWTSDETDENGVAVLYLYEGRWTIRPDTWNTPQYVYSGYGVQQEFSSGDEESGTFELEATTLTVTINARDSDGNILPLHGWANCWEQNGGSGFGASLDYGVAELSAVGGDYWCGVWVPEDSEYQAAGQDLYTFVDGVDQTIDIEMLARTASATVYVKDQDNNLVTDVRAWVYANSTTGSWVNERLEDGVATLRLAPGTYGFGVWFEDQNSYIAGWSYYGEETEIADGENATETITVQAVTGSLTAILEDEDGNPVPFTWVGCSNWPELENQVTGDFEGGRVIENGNGSGTDGVAVIGLVADHIYECWVGVPSDQSLISPGSQLIDLTSSDDVNETFVFQTADATIDGDVEFADGSEGTIEDINWLWCNGWAEEGYSSNDDSTGTEFSLPVISGNWHVWCGTDVVNDDGSRSWYNAQEDTLVEVTGEGSFDAGTITLTESVFEIPESFSETFDATSLKTIVLEDGTTLTIPANALATDGNVTLTAEPELQSYHTYADAPFGFPWNFEVYDGDGVLISGDFNESVTITIPYDEEQLAELGLDESIIFPKVWDDAAGAWVDVTNATQDMDANTITFTVQHFSQIGLVYDNQQAVAAASSKPLKPRALDVKRRKAHSVVVDWKQPSNGDSVNVGRYKVQVRKFQVKDKSKYRKFVVKGKTQRKVKKLKSDTRYQFRVRACNTNGCSDFTKWKKFRTK